MQGSLVSGSRGEEASFGFERGVGCGGRYSIFDCGLFFVVFIFL